MAHKVFEKPIRVHFSNCDPAGIVFHPQYFVLINELMEDFLEDVAGVGFIEIRRYGVGFPVVSVKTQFTKPSRPSDRLMGQVWVEKIGFLCLVASSIRAISKRSRSRKKSSSQA